MHPAAYFYSWTGKQQPILFLTMAGLIIDWEQQHRLPDFIDVRGAFEDFLIKNRALSNQIIRKFGTKPSGRRHLRDYYESVLAILAEGKSHDEVITQLQEQFSYLQPAESPYEHVVPTKYSTQMKSGLLMREFLSKAPRCGICGGLVPAQAISIDHIVRLEDGGRSIVENAQVTHPYCNTGYKEARQAAKS